MTGIARTAAAVLACSAVALLWRPTSVTAQTALLEVDKGEVKLMQVNDDAGLVVKGTLNSGAIPASGSGVRLMWHPGKAALRAGEARGSEWDQPNIGQRSVAMGFGTTASGHGSTALGLDTKSSSLGSTALGLTTEATAEGATALGTESLATGVASTAMGARTTASGSASTAMGRGTRASGESATAMGTNTIAGGANSAALGSNSRALGIHSVAMGTNALSGNGSFVFGDNSTASDVFSLEANQFVVRASGGFRLRTNASLSTGCDLPAGSGTFNCTSSRLAKEGFEDLDGETVLGKLAAMPIQRWRYRGTQTSHVGPTAEDFHAAFELGEGPTTISTVDADGISLLAVQALERRTAELMEENAGLRRRLEALETERAAERKRRAP